MPQMMPINWLIYFISFLLIFYLFNVMNYYNFNIKTPSFQLSNFMEKKIFWKW